MRVDVHTHAYHPKIAGKVLAMLQGHYGITPKGDGTLDDLLARSRAAGLDKVVVHTAATAPAQVIPANNWAMEITRDHPEVVGFGSLHPDFDDNAGEIERLRRNGVTGLKFHPEFQGFSLNDPAFYRLMELVPDDFTLMIHVGDRLPPDQNPSCPYKLRDLRRAFPGPRIIAPHFGGWLHWEHVVQTLCGQDVYIDISSSLPFMEPAQALTILDAHPADRILFGTDYPLFDPAEEIERLERVLGLKPAQVERILTNGAAVVSG